MNGLNVLSLFDGISCGQIALERSGLKVNNYFSSEIDKHAIKVTQHNYPNTFQIGDVTKINVKLLCLSDIYSYICSYDRNLQSDIQEWEVLYWLDKNFTLSAKVATQKPNERQKISESPIIQRIEEIWFSNREMGSIRKCRHNRGRGTNRERNDIEVFEQLQCSDWWYDNDIYRRYKEENIRITNGKTENRDSEKENIGHIKREVFKREKPKNCCGENQESNVEGRCEKKILRWEKEDRFSRKIEEENGNGRKEKSCSIDEVIRELCRWNEINGITQDYWNILRLHKEEQITVVEHDGGFYLFKGVINVLCGGSPCQGFSFSGKQLNFEDPRSKLFFEFIRLLNEIKPKYFLLENVLMKKEFEEVITKYLKVNPITINSSLVSAQNRKRLYWTNIPNIKQPDDKNIVLTDILEDHIYLNKATILGRRLNEFGKREDYNKNIPIIQCLEVRNSNTNKCNCLTTVAKDNVLTPLPVGRHVDVFNKKLPFKYYTIKEYCRLQTVPEDYFGDIVSENQIRKIIGNGWTVDVIAHIFSFIK